MPAEGVLPIAIGEATKLVNILIHEKKVYNFTVQFGYKTATGDAVGEIINKTNYLPTVEQCDNVCKNFLGKIKQTPSKFSAIKINGKRAYKLAREKKEFEMPSRVIEIYQLECLEVNKNIHTATYRVECSKGTYVRTLAEAMAESMGTLCFVKKLQRESVGKFSINNALKIEDFNISITKDNLKENLLDIQFVLEVFLYFEVSESQAKIIKNGATYFSNDLLDCEFCWLKHKGALIAIGSVSNKFFKPSRVFNIL